MRRLLDEALQALQAVHTRGYLHRDIKPANLYIRARDSCMMLIDFGAARQILFSYSKPVVTRILSPGYAPPEQYETDLDDYGPWTDLYALGGVAYQCITGERPVDARYREKGRPLTPAVKAGAGRYGKEVLTAVDRALALRPEERFQSVAETVNLY